MKNKPGANLWLFASQTEIKVGTVLHGPIWYKVDRGPISLIPNPVPNQSTLTPHPVLQEVPALSPAACPLTTPAQELQPDRWTEGVS